MDKLHHNQAVVMVVMVVVEEAMGVTNTPLHIPRRATTITQQHHGTSDGDDIYHCDNDDLIIQMKPRFDDLSIYSFSLSDTFVIFEVSKD